MAQRSLHLSERRTLNVLVLQQPANAEAVLQICTTHRGVNGVLRFEAARLRAVGELLIALAGELK